MLNKLKTIIEKSLQDKTWNVKDNLVDYVLEYLSKYTFDGIEFSNPSVIEDRDMFTLSGQSTGSINKTELSTDFHNYIVKIKSYKDIGKINVNVDGSTVLIEVVYNNLLAKINNYKLVYVHNYAKKD